MLLVAALIHLMPLVGVLGPQALARLYGVDVPDANIDVLLRHRAIMFGLLGLLLVGAALRPELRVAGYLIGFTSAASFVAVAWWVGGYNAAINRVVVADLVALACLCIGAAVEWRLRVLA